MTTPTVCFGCGERTPSSPCEACLEAQAALDSFFRSRGLRGPAKTVPMVRADEVECLREELAKVVEERDRIRKVLDEMHAYNARLVRALEGF